MTIARLGYILSPIVASHRGHMAEIDSLNAFDAPGECYEDVARSQRRINVAHIERAMASTGYTWEELVAEVADRVSSRFYRDYLMEAFSDYEAHLEREAERRRAIKRMMQPWLPGGLGGMQIAEQRQKAITALARRTATRAA